MFSFWETVQNPQNILFNIIAGAIFHSQNLKLLNVFALLLEMKKDLANKSIEDWRSLHLLLATKIQFGEPTDIFSLKLIR